MIGVALLLAAATYGQAEPTMLARAVARQVQPCTAAVPSPGPGSERIRTRIRLDLAQDGTLTTAPAVIEQSGVDDENRRYAHRVGNAAGRVFAACAPYRLPADSYDLWRSIIITYSLPG